MSEDLLKNGLELESVSLTRIDQTSMQFFDANNAAQLELQAKLALINALPKIIEEAVKPMEKIESIRIMQVDGLNGGGRCAGTNGAAPSAPATTMTHSIPVTIPVPGTPSK